MLVPGMGTLRNAERGSRWTTSLRCAIAHGMMRPGLLTNPGQRLPLIDGLLPDQLIAVIKTSEPSKCGWVRNDP